MSLAFPLILYWCVFCNIPFLMLSDVAGVPAATGAPEDIGFSAVVGASALADVLALASLLKN
jgi:hypothetical protein